MLFTLLALGGVAESAAAQEGTKVEEAEVKEKATIEPKKEGARIFVAGGVDAWVSPEGGGHGYVLATYQRDDVIQKMDVDLTYNTDTLQLTGRGLELGESVKVGAFVKGQAIFGGLLLDYYQEGLFKPERGFNASYVQGGVLFEANSDGPVFVELELGGRRWFFRTNDNTSSNLTLPPDMWVFEPRIRITSWNFEHDESFTDAHRHRWRLRGYGGGLMFGSDFRKGWEPWGARDPENFEPVDTRNLNGRSPILTRLWLAGGAQLASRLRLQGKLFVSTGTQEDDLTRTRVGGLNPYVLQVPGVPWASWLPQDFGAAQGSVHLLAFGETEFGVEGTMVTMSEDDAFRVNTAQERRQFVDQRSPFDEQLYGVGVFADMRFGDYQVDATVGWAPNVSMLAESPHISAWLSLGKQF